MSVDALFGILIAALFGLVAVVWRIVWSRLQKIDSGALAAFQAKDTEREKAWWEWRATLDKRMDAHSQDLKLIERRITRLERNGHEPQNNRP